MTWSASAAVCASASAPYSACASVWACAWSPAAFLLPVGTNFYGPGSSPGLDKQANALITAAPHPPLRLVQCENDSGSSQVHNFSTIC